MKIVKFKKTGNLYKVIKDDVLMKNPETRDWSVSVLYETYAILDPDSGEYNYEDCEKLTFVREKTDFNNKFEAYE